MNMLSKLMKPEDEIIYLRTMMDSISDGICIINQEYKIVDANQGFADMLGYTLDELKTLHIWDWDAQATEQQIRAELTHIEKTQSVFNTIHQRKNGETYHAEVSAGGAMINGKAVVFAIVRDITERLRLENELIEFKKTLDQTQDCVFMFDAASLTFTYLNQGAIKQVGYSEDQLMKMHPYDIKPDFDETSFRQLITPMLEGKMLYHSFETRHRHRDGHDINVSIFLQIIRSDVEQDKFIAIVRDITALKEKEVALDASNKNLQKLVNTDPLSMLPNRRAYEEKLEYEITASQRPGKTLSLLVLDIDYFKSYNDTYGHENGDLAITRIGKQLRASLPRKTDFVARYGGEEFVVLLPYTPIIKAKAIAEKLLKDIVALHIEHKASNIGSILTASIGISSTETGSNHLFANADKALYQAKKNGRNRCEMFEKKAVTNPG